jgi:hypothetical protein
MPRKAGWSMPRPCGAAGAGRDRPGAAEPADRARAARNADRREGGALPSRGFRRQAQAPTLIIDVGKEELFDIRENGRKVYDLVKDRIPAKYHLFEEITHYQIYAGEPLREATQLAIDWFSEHL